MILSMINLSQIRSKHDCYSMMNVINSSKRLATIVFRRLFYSIEVMKQGVNQKNVNIICSVLIDQYVDEVQRTTCEEKKNTRRMMIKLHDQIKLEFVLCRRQSLFFHIQIDTIHDLIIKNLARHPTMIVCE